MGEIKEEDLVKLYSELDSLEDQKKELEKAYFDLKIKCREATEQNKINKLVLFILSFVIVALLVFSIFSFLKLNEASVALTNKEQVKHVKTTIFISEYSLLNA